MKVQRTIETAADPAAVFGYLSDFTTTTEWDPGTVVTERLSGDGGVGTRYRNVSRFRGRETELEYRVVELEAPSVIELHGSNATVDAVDRMDIAAVDGGARVTYTAEFSFKGWARLLAPFLRGALEQLADDGQEGMRTALSRISSRP